MLLHKWGPSHVVNVRVSDIGTSLPILGKRYGRSSANGLVRHGRADISTGLPADSVALELWIWCCAKPQHGTSLPLHLCTHSQFQRMTSGCENQEQDWSYSCFWTKRLALFLLLAVRSRLPPTWTNLSATCDICPALTCQLQPMKGPAIDSLMAIAALAFLVGLLIAGFAV